MHTHAGMFVCNYWHLRSRASLITEKKLAERTRSSLSLLSFAIRGRCMRRCSSAQIMKISLALLQESKKKAGAVSFQTQLSQTKIL